MVVPEIEEYPLAYRPNFEDPSIESKGQLTLHVLDMDAPHVGILPIVLSEVRVEAPFIDTEARVTRVAHGVRLVGETASHVECTFVFDDSALSQHVVIVPEDIAVT